MEKKKEEPTIESLQSDLKDIRDLYENQGMELNKIKKELFDVTGDLQIKNSVIKETNDIIETLNMRVNVLKLEKEFADKMENRLNNIIKSLIEVR